MTQAAKKPSDPAVSEVIGEILMVALVVALAAIVSAFVMGLMGSVPNPTLTAFNVESVYNNTTKTVNAVSILCMAGDGVSGKSGGSAGPGLGNELQGINIHIAPPGENSHLVSLCAAIGPDAINITPGTQLFIVKRANTYFLVLNPSQKNCGGGGENQEFTPHGYWTVTIADTLISNTVLYKGDVWL